MWSITVRSIYVVRSIQKLTAQEDDGEIITPEVLSTPGLLSSPRRSRGVDSTPGVDSTKGVIISTIIRL